MASTLPILCLEEILENLRDDLPSLFSCVMSNRHWCKIAIKYLWCNPFRETTNDKILSAIPLMCFDDKKFVFPYLDYIREINYPTLLDITKDTNDVRCNPKAILVSIVNRVNTKIIRLNIDNIREQQQQNDFDDFQYSELSWMMELFDLPAASNSLSQLYSLTICNQNANEVLKAIDNKLCPNLISELKIMIYHNRGDWDFDPRILEQVIFDINRLSSWIQLKSFTTQFGNEIEEDALFGSDNFLLNLANCLPPVIMDNLCLAGPFAFAPENLDIFFNTTKASFVKISLPKSTLIWDSALEAFAKNTKGILKELDIPRASKISFDALSKAKLVIPNINVSIVKGDSNWRTNIDMRFDDENEFQPGFRPEDDFWPDDDFFGAWK
ncbi:9216_t:CDS:2 [Ambispora gerdemannii]|uniref:9216_t:CDS:1 n=1 Tax=Ambispora gerdemannii TaxID=144530 RepID=A0A9N9HCB7_9GLOM|nr:9216_t:CDS:2 [Ambispora gerdemannii]